MRRWSFLVDFAVRKNDKKNSVRWKVRSSSSACSEQRGATLAKDNCFVDRNNLVTDVAVKSEEAARGARLFHLRFGFVPVSRFPVLRRNLVSLFAKEVHLNERSGAVRSASFGNNFPPSRSRVPSFGAKIAPPARTRRGNNNWIVIARGDGSIVDREKLLFVPAPGSAERIRKEERATARTCSSPLEFTSASSATSSKRKRCRLAEPTPILLLENYRTVSFRSSESSSRAARFPMFDDGDEYRCVASRAR